MLKPAAQLPREHCPTSLTLNEHQWHSSPPSVTPRNLKNRAQFLLASKQRGHGCARLQLLFCGTSPSGFFALLQRALAPTTQHSFAAKPASKANCEATKGRHSENKVQPVKVSLTEPLFALQRRTIPSKGRGDTREERFWGQHCVRKFSGTSRLGKIRLRRTQ